MVALQLVVITAEALLLDLLQAVIPAEPQEVALQLVVITAEALLLDQLLEVIVVVLQVVALQLVVAQAEVQLLAEALRVVLLRVENVQKVTTATGMIATETTLRTLDTQTMATALTTMVYLVTDSVLQLTIVK